MIASLTHTVTQGTSFRTRRTGADVLWAARAGTGSAYASGCQCVAGLVCGRGWAAVHVSVWGCMDACLGVSRQGCNHDRSGRS